MIMTNVKSITKPFTYSTFSSFQYITTWRSNINNPQVRSVHVSESVTHHKSINKTYSVWYRDICCVLTGHWSGTSSSTVTSVRCRSRCQICREMTPVFVADSGGWCPPTDWCHPSDSYRETLHSQHRSYVEERNKGKIQYITGTFTDINMTIIYSPSKKCLYTDVYHR